MSSSAVWQVWGRTRREGHVDATAAVSGPLISLVMTRRGPWVWGLITGPSPSLAVYVVPVVRVAQYLYVRCQWVMLNDPVYVRSPVDAVPVYVVLVCETVSVYFVFCVVKYLRRLYTFCVFSLYCKVRLWCVYVFVSLVSLAQDLSVVCTVRLCGMVLLCFYVYVSRPYFMMRNITWSVYVMFLDHETQQSVVCVRGASLVHETQ